MKCRSNGELLRAARELVSRVRGVTRELLVELGEVDVRRLYLEEACPSMFAFCTTRLGFSEDVAYKRIQVAGGHKPAGCGSGPGFRGGAASGSGAGGSLARDPSRRPDYRGKRSSSLTSKRWLENDGLLGSLLGHSM